MDHQNIKTAGHRKTAAERRIAVALVEAGIELSENELQRITGGRKAGKGQQEYL